MGSLIEELRRPEAAARAEADRLRTRIEELSEDLARTEEQASRLSIAREEVVRVLEEPAVAEPPDNARRAQRQAGGEPRPASPAGSVTVPPWQEGAEASVLPRSYQDLLEVAADAGRPLRAAEFAAAAGLGTDRAKVEGLRSKLKLLARGAGWPGCPAACSRSLPEFLDDQNRRDAELFAFRDDSDALAAVRAEVHDGLIFRRLVPGLCRRFGGKPQHDGDLPG